MAAASIGCAVISTNSTGGKLVADQLEENGHNVVRQIEIKQSALMIKGELAILVESSACKAILIVGGTELAGRTTMYDAVEKLLEKRIPGFGEIFRTLSFKQDGSSAIMERATAGIYRGRLIIEIPDSPTAINLAMEQLILPELANMVDRIAVRA